MVRHNLHVFTPGLPEIITHDKIFQAFQAFYICILEATKHCESLKTRLGCAQLGDKLIVYMNYVIYLLLQLIYIFSEDIV